jgi:hypothetical protein
MSETDEANANLQNTPREVNLQSSQQVRVQKLMKQMRSFTILEEVYLQSSQHVLRGYS